MVKNSPKNPFFPQLKRVRQLTPFYCGPATLQMLLTFQNTHLDQETIVKASAAGSKIKTHGMLLEDFAQVVRKTAPHLQFWYKRYATITELSQLVNDYKQPVGIEWQGVFTYADRQEAEDDDPGHYSVITRVSTKENIILIADPFGDYAYHDRRFTILEFERRWWDINEIYDPRKKKRRQIDDYHALFILTPKAEVFPEKLGLEKA